MKHGRIEISQTGYTLENEMLDHLRYQINTSREYIANYISEHYPNSKWFSTLLLKIYDSYPYSPMWLLSYKIMLYFLKRISRKINFQNKDPSFMKERNLATMFRMSL